MRAIPFMLFLSGSLLCSSLPLKAQWISQTKEDPFEKSSIIVALTVASQYAFGIRCETDSKRASFVFITPEAVDKSSLTLLAAMQPKILLIIDNEPMIETSVDLSSADDGKLVGSSEDAAANDIVRKIISSKKRIAVAFEVLGQKVHKAEFKSGNIKKAAAKLSAACELNVN